MTKICYFSGTGNTFWSAGKIAEQIGPAQCVLFNIGAADFSREITITADAVVLLFPAYAYGLPMIVRNFVRKAEFKTPGGENPDGVTPYIAAFVTYGTSPGGALAEISRIFRRKKIKSAWYGRIPAVENYTAIFGPQKQKTIERRLQMQRAATEDAVRRINGQETNRVFAFRPFSAFVSSLFSIALKIFYKWYRVTGNCDGCGICGKICPVSAITMNNGRPVFSKKCEHCQGCIHWCPKQAIVFARVKSGTPRYHHPEVTSGMMLTSEMLGSEMPGSETLAGEISPGQKPE